MGECDPWHNILSYVQWPATRRLASVREDSAIQCKSLVHRDGVDDDLRTGHEKTVPFEGVDGDPRRGHEKTVPFEGVDDDPRRGHEKTVSFEGVDNDLR